MAYIKDYYTDEGRHYVQVSAEGDRWVSYQARMVCEIDEEWLAPCVPMEGQEGIIYDISDSISLSSYPILKENEIQTIAAALHQLIGKGEEYLLEAGGYSNELKYLFWNPRTSLIQGLYIPDGSTVESKEWLQRALNHLLGHAIAKRWPEKEVVCCYRLYQEAFESEPSGRMEEPEESLAESQTKMAKLARYALWDDLEEEEEEPTVQETVEKIKGRVKRLLGKKEK